jgi:hypothetical protein
MTVEMPAERAVVDLRTQVRAVVVRQKAEVARQEAVVLEVVVPEVVMLEVAGVV